MYHAEHWKCKDLSIERRKRVLSELELLSRKKKKEYDNRKMIVRKISTISIQKQRWLSGDPGSDSLMSDIGFQLSPKDRPCIPRRVREGLSWMGEELEQRHGSWNVQSVPEIINLWLDPVLCRGVTLGNAMGTK